MIVDISRGCGGGALALQLSGIKGNLFNQYSAVIALYAALPVALPSPLQFLSPARTMIPSLCGLFSERSLTSYNKNAGKLPNQIILPVFAERYCLLL